MRNLLFTSIFILVSIVSCKKEDIKDPILIYNGELVTLSGTYTLLNVSGGFAGVDDDFASGIITWDFNNVNQTVNISNLNEEEVVHDGFPTGEYSFSIIVLNGNEYLVVDNLELGLMTYVGDDLSVDQNMQSTGPGADGFQYYFGPYVDDPQPEPILSGEYDLYHVTGGFAGVSDFFSSDLIVWNFNAATGILTVDNNNQDQVIHDGFASGQYSFSITEYNGNQFLTVENMEMGRIEFICNELFINGNHWLGGSVDDAFSYSFGACGVESGLWNVMNRSGGIAGLDIDFEVGDVTWDFDADSQQVVIINQLDQPSHAGFSSGTYPYVILTVNDEQFLAINNVELGGMQIIMSQMFLDENDIQGGGSGDDGFQFLLEL